MDGNPNAPRHMTGWEIIVSRTQSALIRWRRRHIPYLVWWGDELDVKVTLKENKLPHIEASDIGAAMQECTSALNRGSFYEVEKLMHEVGISFDKGLGFDGREWEWDWSLSGPISVSFRGRSASPEKRA